MKKYLQEVQWERVYVEEMYVFEDTHSCYAHFGSDLPDFGPQVYALDEAAGWWHECYYDKYAQCGDEFGCYVLPDIDPEEHTMITHLAIFPAIPPDEVRTCLSDEEADAAFKEFCGE